jgi:putative nucleotidyltransferase with HDIG domain
MAIEVMHQRSGKWFDPQLVEVADSLHRRGALWSHCLAGNDTGEMQRAAVDLAPGTHLYLGAQRIDRICEAFADVVDAKSPYTFRHSLGVTDAAVGIAQRLGLTSARVDFVRRAALLHDLGKLSVPNTILDKPGKLDPGEWQAMRDHPVQTRRILERVSAFRELALVAGEHHEKLDGSGYPNRLTAEHLSLESRIVAVADVYSALSEDRPYRAGLDLEQIVKIMKNDLPHKLDRDCFDALIESIMSAAASRPAAETQVCA